MKFWRRKSAPAAPPEGRWRIEPFLERDNHWCAKIYEADGSRVATVRIQFGHDDFARTAAINAAKRWCDEQAVIEAARSREGESIWYGEPSVKSLQARIAELEAACEIAAGE